MLYIFKDGKGKRMIKTEQEAHQELRNKGAWQRQDLVYLGGVGATQAQISSAMEGVKATAKEKLLQSNDTIQNLKLQLEVAKGKNEEITKISLLESEVKLAESNIMMAIRKNQDYTAEEERIVTEYLKILSNSEQEYIDSMEVIQGTFPRDFNKSETRLSGNEVNPSQ